MIKLKNLTLKNFLSIGNAVQAINFNREELVLVLGENLDLGGEDAGSRNGVGKAQPLSSLVLTPLGWKQMGDLRVGDAVISANGKITTISGIFPQGLIDTYRLTFADGRTAEASADHLWNTYSHKFRLVTDNEKERIITTKDIMDHLDKYKTQKSKQGGYIYIPLMIPSNNEKIKLPINPWLLGAILGDGGIGKKGKKSASVIFTTADEFMVNRFNSILQEDFNCHLKLKKSKKNKYDYSVKMNSHGKFNPLGIKLMDLNLAGTHSKTKFIPNCYKLSNTEQKLELLAGLVDTDGTIGKNGGISISTASKQLAEDIIELVRSIGGIAHLKIRKNITYKYKGIKKPCADSYKVSIRYSNMHSLVSLPRKKNRLGEVYQYGSNLRLQITKIEPIGKQNCQCIMINDASHLYVTDNFVVTHNTAIMNGVSYALYSWAISDIKKEHLVNTTNKKNMVVTLDFESDGKNYRVVRGLKPRILEFYEDGVNKVKNKMPAEHEVEDSAQGDNRETQREIEKVIGMSHDMFCQIVAVNTYTQPFLFQKISDQRTIIEQLLGITLLSEKSEQLKEEIKFARETMNKEESRIKAVEDANKRIQKQIDGLILKQKTWMTQKTSDMSRLDTKIQKLSKIDIDHELLIHAAWDAYNDAERDRSNIVQQYTQMQNVQNKELKILDQINSDLKSLQDQCCQTCKQKLETAVHASLVSEAIEKQKNSIKELETIDAGLNGLAEALEKIPVLEKPESKNYDTLSEAHDHRNKLMLLNQAYEQKQNEVDPYDSQIDSMKNSALEVVDKTQLNAYARFIDHQEFLQKLLTNKDSFIRKKIIEQNLNYLNARLNYYLTALGLPHEVVFQNDLSVGITELGRELSPGNLSRGEMARLSLGLSFSFRDVWENLYQRISILMIDESIDAGIDSSGTESAVKLLRDMSRVHHKDVWLISHKDELISKCTSICKVVKENGFTTFDFD